MELSITDEIFDNILFPHRNRYFFIIQPNFSQESDVKLTDKTEIKAVFCAELERFGVASRL